MLKPQIWSSGFWSISWDTLFNTDSLHLSFIKCSFKQLCPATFVQILSLWLRNFRTTHGLTISWLQSPTWHKALPNYLPTKAKWPVNSEPQLEIHGITPIWFLLYISFSCHLFIKLFKPFHRLIPFPYLSTSRVFRPHLQLCNAILDCYPVLQTEVGWCPSDLIEMRKGCSWSL